MTRSRAPHRSSRNWKPLVSKPKPMPRASQKFQEPGIHRATPSPTDLSRCVRHDQQGRHGGIGVGVDDPVRADRLGAAADADDGRELLGDGVLT